MNVFIKLHGRLSKQALAMLKATKYPSHKQARNAPKLPKSASLTDPLSPTKLISVFQVIIAVLKWFSTSLKESKSMVNSQNAKLNAVRQELKEKQVFIF